MSVRVKICGITNLDDALLAVDAGADALGFVFYARSPRRITPADAATLRAKLPPFVSCVGVFVDASPAEIQEVATQTGINVAQLHGSETPELCRALRIPVVKAVRVKDRQSLAVLPMYAVSGYLLDSYVPGQLGGTGARFNWDLALEAKAHERPIILAGGLTPENVSDAIARVMPYAVDVSSGVESAPGTKDPQKTRAFIRRVKGF